MGPWWLPVASGMVVLVALLAAQLRRRPAAPEPAGRPLEDIARDLRRLGPRLHHPPRGVSFAKVEAVRFAYERSLTEACAALGVTHLLEVLPPGEERDAERTRVERALYLRGLVLDPS